MHLINLQLSLFLVLLILVLLSPTLLLPCHADGSQSHDDENNSTLILAAKRTRRIDPSNDFKYYEAGWDITNEHYYLSLLFSAAPVLAVAAVWFLAVLLCFIIALCCFCCCCSKPKIGYSQKAYAISLSFLVIFLLVVIAGGVLLYVGQGNFYSATNEVMDDIVRKAIAVVDIIKDALNNLSTAKNMAVGIYSLPDDFKKNIEQIEKTVNKVLYDPKTQAEKTVAQVNKFLDGVSYFLIIIAAAMLVLAFVGFLISVCGLKVVVYILVFIGWILVTGTLLVCCISFLVQNGVGDTCVAMEDWLQHPQSTSALSKLLPCLDKESSQQILGATKSTSFQMVNLVNAFVVNVANADATPNSQNIFYNQSGPPMPMLCNPFYPNMTERTCDPLEVHLNSAPQAYQGFVCNSSPSGLCNTMGRLTPEQFTQIMVATNMSDTLYRAGPLLIDLIDCTFVAQTFNEITKDHCPDMRRYSSQIFTGLMMVSVGVMLSVILWVVYVRERQHHISSKKLRKTNVGL